MLFSRCVRAILICGVVLGDFVPAFAALAVDCQRWGGSCASVVPEETWGHEEETPAGPASEQPLVQDLSDPSGETDPDALKNASHEILFRCSVSVVFDTDFTHSLRPSLASRLSTHLRI